MPSKRVKQLKFLATIFQMSLEEIKLVMGEETLTMLFRRVGEDVAESIVTRLKGKYESVEEFAQLVANDVINPVLGEGKCTARVDGDTITFDLGACPYKKAGGFPIQEMGFFCHYTEGLFDNAIRLAFPDKNYAVQPKDLISKGADHCLFKIVAE